MRAPNKNICKMDRPTTPPMLDYISGKEIRIKHKEALYQLYKRAGFMPSYLTVLYYIRESSISRVCNTISLSEHN
jgi:hypothetical protein